jgi:Cu/Ag efflux protein CusF
MDSHMNWKPLASASAIMTVLLSAALAEETVGTITAIDNANAKVTLDDGHAYALGEPECSNIPLCPLDTFAVGDRVSIVWETQQGARVATEISVISQ